MRVFGLSNGASPVVRKTGRLERLPRLLAVFTVLLAFISPMLATSPRASANWSPPRTVYIKETGQSIDGYFLDVWRAWGVASLGNPVTPELTESGRIVQYYQYARMEYWPEDPNGDYVKFGSIGRELRPLTVFRNTPGFVGPDDHDSKADLLNLELRAWLPLTGKSATRTDSATWRFIPETQHSVQFGFKDFWEGTGGVDYLGNPVTEEYILDGVTYQVFERGQLAWTSTKGVWLVPVGEVLAKRYRIDMKPTAQGDLPDYSEDLFIPPGPPADGERVIEVNLSSQYLIAWQGDWVVGETYVSTGRPGFDTPPGTYYVLYKLESQTMEGVLGGEYYNVPDVPWVMYFTDVGHALHGTYWHNNFGTPMSHGCVNLPLDFAQWLYYWAPAGTRVWIHW